MGCGLCRSKSDWNAVFTLHVTKSNDLSPTRTSPAMFLLSHTHLLGCFWAFGICLLSKRKIFVFVSGTPLVSHTRFMLSSIHSCLYSRNWSSEYLVFSSSLSTSSHVSSSSLFSTLPHSLFMFSVLLLPLSPVSWVLGPTSIRFWHFLLNVLHKVHHSRGVM